MALRHWRNVPKLLVKKSGALKLYQFKQWVRSGGWIRRFISKGTRTTRLHCIVETHLEFSGSLSSASQLATVINMVPVYGTDLR